MYQIHPNTKIENFGLKLGRVRSKLHQRRFFQSICHFNALAEIYKIRSLILNISLLKSLAKEMLSRLKQLGKIENLPHIVV
jgi:hypothetical protein